jgi:DHA2 family multidrug resistance protein-like MFS transporter
MTANRVANALKLAVNMRYVKSHQSLIEPKDTRGINEKKINIIMFQKHEETIETIETVNTIETTSSSFRWRAFSVLALAVLIVVLDHMVLNVALPTLQRQIGATISELQWIIDAYVMAFAALLLTMGAIGDRIGHTTMLRIGMSVFGLASLAGAFAGSAWHLIAARVFMGVGGAMIMPATLALISSIFPAEERGKAIGAWGAMNGLGVALGPLLGGWLLERFNWNAIFLINVPIVVTAMVAGLFLIPKSNVRIRRRIDLSGTVLSATTIFLLVFGIIKGSDLNWAHPLVYGALIMSFISGLLFYLQEKYTNFPMLDLSLFKNPHLVAGSGSIAIMTFAMFGFLFALTLYMQFVKNYSPMETGLRFIPIAIGYAFGSVSSHKSVLRWGARAVVLAGFAGMATLASLIAFWQTATSFWLIGLCIGLFSFCLGNIMTPSLNVVLGAVPKDRAGVGSAIGNVSFQVGGALGVAALGSVLSSIYRFRMDVVSNANAVFPAQVIRGAMESLGTAVVLADGLPAEVGQRLLLLARSTFMNGWLIVFLVVCFVGIAGVFFVLKLMPANIHDNMKKEKY